MMHLCESSRSTRREGPRYRIVDALETRDRPLFVSIKSWRKTEATITHKDWNHQNHPLGARFSSRNQLQYDASLPSDKYLDTLLGPNSSAAIGHQRSEHNIDGQDILQRRRANQDHLGLPQKRRFQRRQDYFVWLFCSIGRYRILFFLDVGVCQEPHTNVSKRETF